MAKKCCCGRGLGSWLEGWIAPASFVEDATGGSFEVGFLVGTAVELQHSIDD
jgi:hypothetical protein